MIGIMIVPTGLDAAIGGHSGDASPAAALMASCCDTLITHPNVLNASDLFNKTDNTLYTVGAFIDQMLAAEIGLLPQEVVNHTALLYSAMSDTMFNAVNAARRVHGCDVSLHRLDTPLKMRGSINEGTRQAWGEIEGDEELVDQMSDVHADNFAVYSPIDVEPDIVNRYKNGECANPWGRVEAILSHRTSARLRRQVAHAPVETGSAGEWGVSDPRLSPEMICGAHLVSVLAGLKNAPLCTTNRARGIWVDDVDFMVSPMCWGLPHILCRDADIPIIMVRENTTVVDVLSNKDQGQGDAFVTNYLEAAGIVQCHRAGVHPSSVTT